MNRIAARRALTGAFAAIVLAGCAGGRADAGVQPVGGADPGTGESARSGSAPTPASEVAPERSSTTTPKPPAEPGEDLSALAAEVDDLLARYDAAYSELAENPLVALDDTSAPVVGWHEVVLPGSTLDTYLRGQLMVDARDNRILYRPDANGVLLVSHAYDPALDTDGSITWRSCVFTPWIEVDADSGSVIDDRPFKRTGSGRAVRDKAGSLVVAELSEDELVELAGGSGDPCPAAVGPLSSNGEGEVPL